MSLYNLIFGNQGLGRFTGTTLFKIQRVDSGSNEFAGKVLAADSSGNVVPVSAAASAIPDGDKGDITTSSSGTVWTIDNKAVTYAKMQDVSDTDKLLGRYSAGAGTVQEIPCSAAGRWLLTGFSGVLTIDTGSITPTGHLHLVETESGAASDDLDTIDGTDVPPAARLVLAAADDGHTVVVKNGTGNIYCGADFSLASSKDTIELMWTGAEWVKMSASTNA